LDETDAFLDPVALKAARARAGPNAVAAADATPGVGGLWPSANIKVHFDFRNRRTGEAGSAAVSTNDNDALSDDPIQRGRFLRALTNQKVGARRVRYSSDRVLKYMVTIKLCLK